MALVCRARAAGCGLRVVVELALVTGAERIFLLAIVVVLLYLIVAPREERKLQKQ